MLKNSKIITTIVLITGILVAMTILTLAYTAAPVVTFILILASTIGTFIYHKIQTNKNILFNN